MIKKAKPPLGPCASCGALVPERQDYPYPGHKRTCKDVRQWREEHQRRDPVAILQRLKRRFGRERARLDKWAQDKTSRILYRDRCIYEANQWSAAMSMLDEEIRKAKR